jgi:hypothetical protein
VELYKLQNELIKGKDFVEKAEQQFQSCQNEAEIAEKKLATMKQSYQEQLGQVSQQVGIEWASGLQHYSELKSEKHKKLLTA